MIRIGIICPSEIAARRFLPALSQSVQFRFAGVAVADKSEFAGATDDILMREFEKAESMVGSFGGSVFQGYHSLIESPEVDAVYLPLPPGLHYPWAKRVLEAGKHAFVEKPFTAGLHETEELIGMAQDRGLALHENYMFVFHKQMEDLRRIVDSGRLGDVRLYRISFGFPLRPLNDFRYNRSLGGGALLDCAGYTMRCASFFLGDKASVISGVSNGINGFDVDMYGSAVMVNTEGVTAQLAWGMDNSYRCDLDVWGSKGSLHSGRVLTAPAGFIPTATLKIGNDAPFEIELSADNAFLNSMSRFASCIKDEDVRCHNYEIIRQQAKLVDQFERIAL